MLTLLIPGPKQPGNDIDIFLEPLIEDLKVLWNDGINIYDASSKSMFNLKAILMWTISDFPADGNLAGCATKGKLACPICGVHTCSEWLKHSKKHAYIGHRRFLESNHPFLKKHSWFDGKEATGRKPEQLTGQQILHELRDVVNEWGKKRTIDTKKRKPNSLQRWKKKSIFFDLPYWEVNVFTTI